MRDLKFRAWNGKSMEYIDDLYWFEENHVHYNGDGYGQENIIMQFTGLFDSNAKKIYEGDVIEYQIGKRGVVTWLSEADGFDFTGWVTTYLNCNCTANGARVIGNVHENPDLL